MGKEYAYARISRKTQKIERQIENLTRTYPDARLYQEAYTGTKTEGRKEFNKMLSVIKPGGQTADAGIQQGFRWNTERY